MSIPPLHGVDLKALRLFCEIVACGGFTAAQIKLNASQSVMSNQIKLLEDRLKMRLCERGRKGFRLTEEGEIVHQAALDLFAAMENFRTVVSRDASELSGELRVSLIDNTATNPESRIFEAIHRLRQRAPGVELALSIGSTVDLETSVIDGSRDMAIGYFHHRLPALNYLPLFKETHHLFCSKDHPAAGLTGKALQQQLTEASYVESTYIDNNEIDTEPLPCGVSSNSPNIEVIGILVLSGNYLGYLPAHYAEQWVVSGKLVPLEPGRYVRKVDFHLVTAATRPRRLVASAFIEELVNVHRESVVAAGQS